MSRFTEGELEVMQVLWAHGELKPGEIQERFPRSIRNAALRSVLLVLLEKRHVTRRKVGKAYYYQSKTPRAHSLRAMVSRMADVFSGGSSAALIAQLIKAEDLSETEIQELQRITTMKAEEKVSHGKGDRT